MINVENKMIYITTSGVVITPYKKKQSLKIESFTSMRDYAIPHKYIEVTGFRVGNVFLTHHLPGFLYSNEFPDYEIKEVRPMTFTKLPEDLEYSVKDNYELREGQYSVVHQILKNKKNRRWFIHCPQGFGKTLISIYLTTQFRMNTLIMCYSTDILHQWAEKIEENTNFPMNKLLTISSGSLITEIIDGEFPIEEYHIFLATPVLLYGYAKKHGLDSLSKLFKKLGIGLKIYDEAHRNLGNMTRIDALSSVAYTIYLSGDFATSSKYKTIFFNRLFSDVKVVRPDEQLLFDLRYTKGIVVEYNTHPSDLDTLGVFTKRGLSVWEFMDYQIKNGMIFRVLSWIVDNITSLHEKDRRILLLTHKIEHCETFYNFISERYGNYNVGMHHGERTDEENSDAKDNAQILVATYSSFSTGMDTKNIKYVISTSPSNRIEDNQASGRARPLDNGELCMFWMLVDIGFENLVKKEQERIEYLKSMKVVDVTRLTYEDIN